MEKNESARIGFRVWLLVLTIFASVPMLLFSIISLGLLLRSQGEVERDRLSRAAASLAGGLERHLAARASMLTTIANSAAAKNGDLRLVYEHAARIVRQYPRFASITLAAETGEIAFSTLQPLGVPLPKSQDMELLRRVLRTGQAHVSGVFEGTITHRKVTVLGVPLVTDAGKRYCLENVLPVVELEAILAQQHLGDAWTSAVLGPAGGIIACHGPRPDAGEAAANSRGNGAFLRDPDEHVCETRAGELVETSLAGVGLWGWTVSVSVPQQSFVAPLRRLLMKISLAAALCLLSAILASFWLARRLSRDVTRLATASAALAAGSPGLDGGVLIREMGEVRACLWAAHEREEQALHDPLTGLAGRARFWDLARELEARAKEDPKLGLAVMFIDLDGFKHVNDHHGHARGDWILQRTAAALCESIRDTDVAGRLGGDEFVVGLIADGGQLRQAAGAIAERIVSRVRNLGYGIGCSIGVSLCRNHPPDLERSLSLADQAMYEAKALGKNRYVLREDTIGG
ncbi:diguanylate cyclase [Solidesulfovibrio fructosivorans JJ]]|uniref:diguanylate cyclase n=1 Tax=Solidesulfovibrio fructosivorans JJ] TaxID=596151 RepID=E1JX78_SOLFR|nr:diguanylate cyclase [Solidesulfovibrio fructosivorans]EFL51043.1 diguanylate cyclase [Solidesulfovibrio fructosivorans JJ]]